MKRVFKQGFTLVELSIVIIIIGFLIAGISGGQSLINAARLNKVIDELSKYDMAVSLFYSQYDAIPGDMSAASSYWPSAYNGNNNGIVEYGPAYVSGGETYYVWQHLSLAKLIDGSYTGANSGVDNGYGGDVFAPGVNVPISAYPNSIYTIVSNSAWNNYSPTAPVIYFINSDNNNNHPNPTWSIVGIIDAYNLDTKMDDGNPFIGKLATFGADPGTHCTNYNLSDLDGGSLPTNPRYLIEDGNLHKCAILYGLLGYTFKGLGQ